MADGSAGKLQGNTAVITGGANGIGRAIARAFAMEGANVAILDQAGDEAQATAAEIRATGTNAIAVGCDVSQSEQVKAGIEATVAEFGALHVVVGGAAVFVPPTPIHELSETDWQRSWDVNVTGCFLLCRHAIPHLKAAAKGSIILISSQMGQVAYAGQATYCATKGALRQLAKGIALDLADDNIRVNTLSPGGVVTNRLVSRFGSIEDAQRIWGPTHPLKRLGEPEEIAKGAVFLASDDASFMTGADLLLDGGYTAW